MIDSLYGDLPPPQFGQDDGNPTIFISDAIKPLLKPVQTVTTKLNPTTQSIHPHPPQSQLNNSSHPKHLDPVEPIQKISKPDYLSNYDIENIKTKECEIENNISDDEYNPADPNSYDEYINDLQIKRKIFENKLRSKGHIDLNMSGEDAWKRRAAMTDSITINESGNKKNLAARLMEKMGWKEGEGLGKDKQGIKAPLIAKKVNKNSAVIISQDLIPNKSTKTYSSRILCIKSSDLLPLDLVEREASKHGKLISINSHGSTENRIFLEFETEIQGINCYKNMNNMPLAGKLASLCFYPVADFINDNLDCPI